MSTAQQGLDFLKQVRAAFPAGSSPGHQLGNAETLRRLEKFSPGFTAWGTSLGDAADGSKELYEEEWPCKNTSLCWSDCCCFRRSAQRKAHSTGTWRPDPQRPSHPETEMAVLADGRICSVRLYAALHGQGRRARSAPPGNPYYDSINIAIIDDHTITKTGKKDGKVALDSKVTVSADGATKTEVQTLIGMAPVPIELTAKFSRVSAGKPGSHLVSGGWQMTEMDVSNHAEDTTFKVSGGALSMTDRMGRSFTAKFDGTPAPYKGSDEFNGVSLKLVDERTIEESDLSRRQGGEDFTLGARAGWPDHPRAL